MLTNSSHMLALFAILMLVINKFEILATTTELACGS